MFNKIAGKKVTKFNKIAGKKVTKCLTKQPERK